jgi:hypothetical protein
MSHGLLNLQRMEISDWGVALVPPQRGPYQVV